MTTPNKNLLLLISFLVLTFSCRKDNNEFEFPTSTNNGSTITTSVSGLVKTARGKPYPACTIEINGQIAVTDNRGIYTLHNISVPAKRAIITCRWNNEIQLIKAFVPSKRMNYVNFQYIDGDGELANASQDKTFLTIWGAEVTIPANSLVDEAGAPYHGVYNIHATYLNPDSPLFGATTPGGDLLSADNDILYSYGMMDVALWKPGSQKLKLAPGATATIRFPVAASQFSTAPAYIPACILMKQQQCGRKKELQHALEIIINWMYIIFLGGILMSLMIKDI